MAAIERVEMEDYKIEFTESVSVLSLNEKEQPVF